jgi:hypothetical protein
MPEHSLETSQHHGDYDSDYDSLPVITTSRIKSATSQSVLRIPNGYGSERETFSRMPIRSGTEINISDPDLKPDSILICKKESYIHAEIWQLLPLPSTFTPVF